MLKNLCFIAPILICNISAAQCDAGFSSTIAGNTATFNASNPATNVLHSWNFGDGNWKTGNPVSNTYSFSGNFSVTHVVHDPATNCTDSIIQTISITVPDACSASFIVIQDSFQINQYQLISTSSNSTGQIIGYSWYLNDSLFSTIPSPSLTLAEGIDTVCLTISTNWGCYSNTCQIITTSSQGCAWTASILSNEIGQGQFQFTADPIRPGSIYEWQLGDGAISNQSSFVHNYLASGTYNVILKVIDSVSSCVDTAWISVNVLLAPPNSCYVDYTFAAVGLEHDSLSFVANSNQTISSQTWTIQSLSGNYVDSIFMLNPTIQFPDTGYYNVCVYVTTSTGCVANWCSIIEIRNPGSAAGRIANIPAYPNPVTTEEIKFKLSAREIEKVKISVYNASGIISLQKDQVLQPGENIITLPTTGLRRGQYFVDIQYKSERKRSTFQKL